jgi:hypothetical protein
MNYIVICLLYYSAQALLFALAIRICEKHLSRIW